MKDVRVPRLVVGLLFSAGMGLSGCNGCSGCEGQTTASPDPAAAENADEQTQKIQAVTSVASVAPSAAPALSASVVVIPSALPNPDHDPTGVRRCCGAIAQNLTNAPDKHKATWKSALTACDQAAEKQLGRKGLEPVKEILTPVGWPAACQ